MQIQKTKRVYVCVYEIKEKTCKEKHDTFVSRGLSRP